MVIPGLPHHVTQRGNRRQKTFFNDGDYVAYLELMAEWCREEGVEIWSYCLMPNHVHLIAVPQTADGLRRGIGEAHRRYTRRINFREKWRGYLWQGRFASFVMDEPYLLAAARYVELNPVRAKLVEHAPKWRWSSAKAHLSGRDDRLVKVAPLLAGQKGTFYFSSCGRGLFVVRWAHGKDGKGIRRRRLLPCAESRQRAAEGVSQGGGLGGLCLCQTVRMTTESCPDNLFSDG